MRRGGVKQGKCLKKLPINWRTTRAPMPCNPVYSISVWQRREAARLCLNRGKNRKSARFCLPKEEWRACREEGEGARCNKIVDIRTTGITELSARMETRVITRLKMSFA